MGIYSYDFLLDFNCFVVSILSHMNNFQYLDCLVTIILKGECILKGEECICAATLFKTPEAHSTHNLFHKNPSPHSYKCI